MKFKKAYDLLLYYFQDILDVTHDLNWKPNEREAIIMEICGDYKNSFKSLKEYSDGNIWQIILQKFNEKFDYLLYDRTHERI